jgi:tetratricopeptide (TPR) repeat protein
LYERADLFDEAIIAYQEALARDPAYLKACFNVARLYHTQGEYAEAIAYFQKVLALDPYNAHTYNNLGLIYEELGDQPQAIVYFRKATEIDMFCPETHLNLARALYDFYRIDIRPDMLQHIMERLQMALSIDPHNDETKALLHEIETALP